MNGPTRDYEPYPERNPEQKFWVEKSEVGDPWANHRYVRWFTDSPELCKCVTYSVKGRTANPASGKLWTDN